MELVKLNRLIRPAVALVKGMEIVHAGGFFEFSVLSAIPWFKVCPRLSIACSPRPAGMHLMQS